MSVAIDPVPGSNGVVMRVTGRAAQHRIADNPQSRWCSADELAALGLPAPVRTLLQSIL